MVFGIYFFTVMTKESLESMEVEFIPTSMSTNFFKHHQFYIKSVAPIFKTEVQSQIPIKKDKMVLLFFRLRTSKACLKVLSRNRIRLLIWPNVFFAWSVESVAPW